MYYNEETGVVSFNMCFDAKVEDAVIRLKKDAGYIDPDGLVTLNVMKALLSMDTFVLLSSYGGKASIREMQQKFNRKYESYIGMIPCDGVFGRRMNSALIYALQAEQGVPVGDKADGIFGSETKKLCPQIPYVRDASAARSYSGAFYTDAQISSMVELVQFSLYLNGFGDGIFDGRFLSNTQRYLRDFQRHYALSVNGRVDIDTWMSLLLSSGNTERSAPAADCAQPLTPTTVKTLYDHGYRYIGRYLTGTYDGGKSKALTVKEEEDILNGGLRFFPIYQSGQFVPHDPMAYTYFTAAQGEYDANAAINAALALGIPKNTILYFAVDCDPQDGNIPTNILPYFQKVNEIMSQGVCRTGVYGTR